MSAFKLLERSPLVNRQPHWVLVMSELFPFGCPPSSRSHSRRLHSKGTSRPPQHWHYCRCHCVSFFNSSIHWTLFSCIRFDQTLRHFQTHKTTYQSKWTELAFLNAMLFGVLRGSPMLWGTPTHAKPCQAMPCHSTTVGLCSTKRWLCPTVRSTLHSSPCTGPALCLPVPIFF